MELIKQRISPIYETISKLQIDNELWLNKLIISIFEVLFDFCIIIRLYDCMISLGINFLINFILALLKNYQNKIINFKDKSSFLHFFSKKIKFKNDNDILIYRERIIKLSLGFNISQETIKIILNNYNNEMKLKNNNDLIYEIIQNKNDKNFEVEMMNFIDKEINGSKEKLMYDENTENNKVKIKKNKNNGFQNKNDNNDENENNENNNFNDYDEINTNKKKKTLNELILFNTISNDIEDENKLSLNQNESFNFDIDKENNTYRNKLFDNNNDNKIIKGTFVKNDENENKNQFEEEEIEETQLNEIINKKWKKNEIENKIKEVNKENGIQIQKDEIKYNQIKVENEKENEKEEKKEKEKKKDKEKEKEKEESDEDSIIPIDISSNEQ